MFDYQEVNPIKSYKTTIFPWFSYGFPMVFQIFMASNGYFTWIFQSVSGWNWTDNWWLGLVSRWMRKHWWWWKNSNKPSQISSMGSINYNKLFPNGWFIAMSFPKLNALLVTYCQKVTDHIPRLTPQYVMVPSGVSRHPAVGPSKVSSYPFFREGA